MINAIELNGVTKEYNNFTLDNVSFQVPRGCIMGLIGENGAGKTTTLKAILNLIHINSGNIKVLGMDSVKDEKKIKEQIGVVFDESCFHDNLTVTQISKIMGNIYSTWQADVFEQYVTRFKLPKDKMIKEYSRGMKTKLSIAAALSHNANLLILDEATSGLDPVVRNEILDIFMDFIQDENHSILLSSHITSDLEKIADYITFIHKGKIIFSKPKDDLIDNYGVVRCGADEYKRLDKEYKGHIIGIRKNQFEYEIMVDNKRKLRQSEPGLVVDNTSIEELILFYVK
jgi:ABC-2 type transport system ATP-binding protein